MPTSPKPSRLTTRPRPKQGKIADEVKKFESLLKGVPTGTDYKLRLFITGTTPRSILAIANIRSLCDEYLAGRYDLEVIDIYQQPGAAATEQIIAAPTLVKQLPLPLKRLIGDLSDRDKVIVGLDLRGASGKKAAAGIKWVKV